MYNIMSVKFDKKRKLYLGEAVIIRIIFAETSVMRVKVEILRKYAKYEQGQDSRNTNSLSF